MQNYYQVHLLRVASASNHLHGHQPVRHRAHRLPHLRREKCAVVVWLLQRSESAPASKVRNLAEVPCRKRGRDLNVNECKHK